MAMAPQVDACPDDTRLSVVQQRDNEAKGGERGRMWRRPQGGGGVGKQAGRSTSTQRATCVTSQMRKHVTMVLVSLA